MSAYRRYATYRVATAAGVITNTVFGFIRALVLVVLWRQRHSIGGYGEADAVTYVFLGQGLAAALGLFGTMELSQRVRSGDIVVDLFRPLDFQGYWLAGELGKAGYQLLARGLPPFVIGALALPVVVPTSPLVWLLFAASTACAVVLSFALRYLVALSAFWLFDDRGATQITSTVTMFFSGFILPIVVFPGWLATLARVLPFSGMLQVPIDVFVGQSPGWAAVRAIAFQVGWTAVLLLLGRHVTARARLRLEVQGG